MKKINIKAYLTPILLCVWTIIFLSGCGPNAYLPKRIPDPIPLFYVPERVRVALVLGSGGVRGTAHLGVLEELEAAGIPIDLIVGCSAGSIVGALYADNPDSCAIKHAVWHMRTDSILEINFLDCRYGLSTGRAIRRILDRHLRATRFDQLKIPLVVVASDLYTGELVPMGGGNLIKAVRASCSIPFVFVPCKYMGRILVDGSVINPVPVQIARDLGAEVIIAVDLCELLPKTCPSNLFEMTTRSAEIAFMWQNDVCTRGANVIIRPRTCGVGTFDDHGKYQTYMAGKIAARKQIPYIKHLLNSCEPVDKCKSWKLVQMKCYAPQICEDRSAKTEDAKW